MLKTLVDIRQRLRAGEYKNEEHVRLALVIRLVQELGWNIWNPTEVYPEFKATELEDNTRVDVALFAHNFAADTIFIECKHVGRIGDDLAKVERQLRDYNRNHSALFTIITDGQHWRFYYALTAGEFAQKLFARFNLLADELGEVAETLLRFLSRPAILDGSARHAAESYLLLSRKERAMQDVLPEAEKRITQPPFPTLPNALVELLSAKGLVVTQPEAVTFLAGDALPRPAAPLLVPLKALPPVSEPAPPPMKPVRKKAGSVTPRQKPAPVFELAMGRVGVKAQAVLLESKQMKVLAGSTAATVLGGSFRASHARVRTQLIDEGVLVPDGEIMRYTRDAVLTSAAQAADVICGYAVNARLAWKDANGKILGDYIGS